MFPHSASPNQHEICHTCPSAPPMVCIDSHQLHSCICQLGAGADRRRASVDRCLTSNTQTHRHTDAKVYFEQTIPHFAHGRAHLHWRCCGCTSFIQCRSSLTDKYPPVPTAKHREKEKFGEVSTRQTLFPFVIGTTGRQDTTPRSSSVRSSRTMMTQPWPLGTPRLPFKPLSTPTSADNNSKHLPRDALVPTLALWFIQLPV